MEVLKPGHILRIPDFDLGNGTELRDKYLIVIEVSETQSLFLQVLTTSQLKVPLDKAIHGVGMKLKTACIISCSSKNDVLVN